MEACFSVTRHHPPLCQSERRPLLKLGLIRPTTGPDIAVLARVDRAPAARSASVSDPPHTARANIALLILGLGFVCVWCSVAALTTCLNETPAFAREYASAAPGIVSVAQGVLGLVGKVVPR